MTQSPAAIAPSSREDFFRRMVTIRRCEEALAGIFEQGLSFGTVHLCIGQEAVPVGAVGALQEGDIVTSNHRGHGHFIARTDNPEGLIAEILGRSSGVVGGWGGSQHLYAEGFYSNGITGGMVPISTGMALAEKERATGNIILAFQGDGSLGHGVVYESWNLAALWKLPIVFVVEHNGYAMSTATSDALAGVPPDRPRAFGLNVLEVDGQDVEAVHQAALTLTNQARAGQGAGLLYCHTYRLCGHSKSDKREYRTREEEARWQARDPLELLGAKLTDDQRTEADDAARTRIDAAVSAALEAGFPVLEEGQVEALQAYPHQAPTDAVVADRAAGQDETYQQAIRRGLKEVLQADPLCLLIGEDLEDPYGGAFKVTKGLSTALPDRVRNTPLSEAMIMGVTGGAALRGLHPIAEIMFSDFLTLTADQLINHIGKFRTMWGGLVDVPVLIRTAAGGRRGYGATHSQCMERLVLPAPGLSVVAPSLYHDVAGLLHAALAHPAPTLFVEQKLFYPRKLVGREHLAAEGLETWNSGAGPFPIVHISNVKPGKADVCIVSYGAATETVMEALTAEPNTGWELLLPTCIRPLPTATLARAAARCGRMVVVEEGPGPWGWGSEVAAVITELVFEALKAPILRVAGADLPLANSRPLEEALLPTPSNIREAILEVLE